MSVEISSQRRINCIGNHIVDHEQHLRLENNLVAGELKNFYNHHIRDRALNLKNKINTPRNPRSIGTFEALLIWFYIVTVSFPWLSYILIISFSQKSRKKNVSMVNAWAQFILTKILRIRLIIDDREAQNYGSPPYVFVLLNQSSLLDSLLIVPAALPPSTEVFVFANIEFLIIPIIGWVFWKTLGSQMVIRQNKAQAQQALDTAMKRMIEDKASMIISIEGKRNEVGKLSDYKKGPAVFAIKTNATIIPVIIRGSAEIWPYGDWKLKPGGDVIVKFLPSISTDGMTLEDRTVFQSNIDRDQVTLQLRKLAENELNIK